jgi:hypothetical protein
LLAEEARQIKMAAEKKKAAETEARLTAERNESAQARLASGIKGIAIARHSNDRRVKDFSTIKARRDALRKAEQQSVEGACLNKIFRDDADQFLFEARTWMRACEMKLLELSGGEIDPDAKFPYSVLELFFDGFQIVDENLKETGRETIIEWCFYSYEDDSRHYCRPLLVTPIEYAGVLTAFKTLFERFQHTVSASNNLRA